MPSVEASGSTAYGTARASLRTAYVAPNRAPIDLRFISTNAPPDERLSNSRGAAVYCRMIRKYCEGEP
jgi:hypothetical protein